MSHKKLSISVLQHVPFEGPGHIAVWAARRGHRVSVCHRYAGDPVPVLRETDMVVVLGGSMNIYEEERFPWLAEEKRFLKEAISAGKIVVGICLGAQLIADALGGRVYAHTQREIGWYPVMLTGSRDKNMLVDLAEAEFMAFHWHGDTFDVPPAAVQLARSRGCEQQAFIFGDRVLGLQFHLESTQQSIADLLKNFGKDIVFGPFVQDAGLITQGVRHCPELNGLMEKVLDRLTRNLQ